MADRLVSQWLEMAPSQDDRYKPPSFKRVDDHVVEESDMLAHEFVIGFQIVWSESNPGSAVYRNLQAWLKTDPGQWILEHSCRGALYCVDA
jgi:hypothetical protein